MGTFLIHGNYLFTAPMHSSSSQLQKEQPQLPYSWHYGWYFGAPPPPLPPHMHVNSPFRQPHPGKYIPQDVEHSPENPKTWEQVCH